MTNKEFYSTSEDGTIDDKTLHPFMQQLEPADFGYIVFSDEPSDIENAIANIRQQYQCWLNQEF